MYDHYDGLIFDMDGTLVDSGKLHEKAWTATLEKYQIPIDFPLMRSLAGVPTKGTIEILLKNFDVPALAAIDEMNHFKENFVHNHMHEFVKPTALAEIARQYHGKKPMAVGTGAYTQEAKTILKLCGLDHLVTVIVGADQVKNPKPAPDTFLRCAELLNVNPLKCVVFEDSPLGLRAAADAGMAGVDVLRIHNIVNDYFLQ
jgi:beta-phosphoglucomutase family hydrolase